MAKSSNSLNLISNASMISGAKKLYNAIRKYAPYKKIKDSVFISRVEGKGDSRFITVAVNMNPATGGAPYARAFDIGSGLRGKYRRTYDIDPVNAPFLQFIGTKRFAGKIIRTSHVDHPGVRGVKYTEKAIKEVKPEIRKSIADDVGKSIRLYLKSRFQNLGDK